MSDPIRILILGTGTMARVHVEAFSKMRGVTVVGGVDMREDALAAFCDRFGIEHRFTSLEAAIKWGGFDAASNVTPDNAHYATSLTLIAAGKHVLCEKPLSTDYARAREMTDAAHAAGVVNMVNLSYRNVAALQKAAAMIASGEIGTVRHFEASYLQSWLTQAAWGDWRSEPGWLWRLSTGHGSKGVLGDIGIHIIDFATFAAGSQPVDVSCRLKTFQKAPGDRIGEYVLDANDSFVMHMELENGAVGSVSATRFASGHLNDLYLRIHGDKGGLEVSYVKNKSVLRACLGEDMPAGAWRKIATGKVPTIYDRFVAAIRGEGPMEPGFERGAVLQKVLDLGEMSSLRDSRRLRISVPDEPEISTGEEMVFSAGG
jgi:predicted dehydrogenase